MSVSKSVMLCEINNDKNLMETSDNYFVWVIQKEEDMFFLIIGHTFYFFYLFIFYRKQSLV